MSHRINVKNLMGLLPSSEEDDALLAWEAFSSRLEAGIEELRRKHGLNVKVDLEAMLSGEAVECVVSPSWEGVKPPQAWTTAESPWVPDKESFGPPSWDVILCLPDSTPEDGTFSTSVEAWSLEEALQEAAQEMADTDWDIDSGDSVWVVDARSPNGVVAGFATSFIFKGPGWVDPELLEAAGITLDDLDGMRSGPFDMEMALADLENGNFGEVLDYRHENLILNSLVNGQVTQARQMVKDYRIDPTEFREWVEEDHPHRKSLLKCL